MVLVKVGRQEKDMHVDPKKVRAIIGRDYRLFMLKIVTVFVKSLKLNAYSS